MKVKSAPFMLFGIFGHPLSHTLSPVMQEAGFEKIGLKAFYGVFDLDAASFRKTCRGLPRLMLDGFNVTVPYKQAVMPYLDQLTPEARAVGAVNTVFKHKHRWVGTNTDVYGFLEALKKSGFRVGDKNALILGAGGAARAAAYGLASQKAAVIFIANRHLKRAEALAREFRKIFPKTNFEPRRLEPETIKSALLVSDLVVNSTSVGLKASDHSVLPGVLIPQAGKKAKLFFDLIYHQAETPFLKAAKNKGHRILGGKGMLLFQGVKAFELWTGRKAPENEMRRALEAAIQGQPK